MSFRSVASLSNICNQRSEIHRQLRNKKRDQLLQTKREPHSLPDVCSTNDFPIVVECLQKRMDVEENLRRLRFIIVKTKGNCIDTLIDYHGLPVISQILVDTNSSIDSLETCLWIFINITSMSDVYVFHVLSLGILNHILTLTQHSVENIRTNALWVISNIATTKKAFNDNDVLQYLLPTITQTLKMYIDNTPTVEACASIFEKITIINQYQYQYYHPIIVLFYGLPRYPHEFIDGMTQLITQKQTKKAIFSNEKLLPTLASLLDPQHSQLTQSILTFFVQVTNLSQKYSQKLFDNDTFEFIFNNFKERLRLLRENETESLELYFIIWGNLCLLGGNAIKYIDDHKVLIQILATFQWYIQSDYDSLVFVFNNIILYGFDEVKEYICCEQLFLIYTYFLKDIDKTPQSTYEALNAIRLLLVFGDENDLDTKNYYVSTGLESIINELCSNSIRKISDSAQFIYDLFEAEDNLEMSE
ncbi:hypothetical protein ENUP19_0036G0027 [Entamoeba nuttalli]|uniref:Importin alpha n=2 Tax=Entamoeba nuttalli TaxID=412467 RepID=K2H476_ENTNP|nr:hypothetical protein ENU1_023910 [Entamoeba nuttalli P19]EKE42353.1 hypothetical protein ENU1_023910 [Entamoeba nuttalli P19]|eukprot:XP_008855313.1 hypothetical protein ENU1_023910 [Entamoeba nuttalli P19]